MKSSISKQKAELESQMLALERQIKDLEATLTHEHGRIKANDKPSEASV